jgi:hypothetical protein
VCFCGLNTHLYHHAVLYQGHVIHCSPGRDRDVWANMRAFDLRATLLVFLALAGVCPGCWDNYDNGIRMLEGNPAAAGSSSFKMCMHLLNLSSWCCVAVFYLPTSVMNLCSDKTSHAMGGIIFQERPVPNLAAGAGGR